MPHEPAARGQDHVSPARLPALHRAAPIESDIEDLLLGYHAPGIGHVSFTWDAPLTINGRIEPLGDYARFDNPYCVSPYGSGRYVINGVERKLVLDFNTAERTETFTPLTSHR